MFLGLLPRSSLGPSHATAAILPLPPHPSPDPPHPQVSSKDTLQVLTCCLFRAFGCDCSILVYVHSKQHTVWLIPLSLLPQLVCA